MALVLFLAFFLLSQQLPPSMSEPQCPQSFNCGKLGSFQFPFYNTTTDAQCGLCQLCCIEPAVPKIQLGTWSSPCDIVERLPSNGTSTTLIINDPLLQEHLNGRRCEELNDFTIPSSPSITFTLVHNITVFKCLKSTESTLQTHNYSSYYHRQNCHDYNLYYRSLNESIPAPTNFPANCTVIHLPVHPPEPLKYPNHTDLFSLVTACRIYIELRLTHDCETCHYKKGRCTVDHEKFHCAYAREVDSDKTKHRLIIIITAIVGSAFILTLCLVIFLTWRRYNYKWSYFPKYFSSKKSSRDLEDGSVYFGVPVFSYTELEDATNNFDPAKELGDGGFGAVYYGKLRDGREVAVKRLYENNYKRVEQFMNEVDILTRLRHRNLVLFYGCTSRRSRELLLVYEYVPNGTVADHLHGDRAKPNSLTWPIRMNIAIETASALAYLHASEIIHRDVKTNNILLDENFNVKVADFGLSRLLPNNVSHVSTAPQGTPGYVDPDYHQCYQLTDKSDVYSFGVVLIELISSMPAVDISRHRDEINLANLAITRIQRCAFNELIDPCLGFETNATVEQMTTSVAELAFRCLQFDKEVRPTMKEALEVLKEIQDEIKEGNDSVGELTNVKPPPSPEMEDVVLLKNGTFPPSPISVTDKWLSSRSTTPSTSG